MKTLPFPVLLPVEKNIVGLRITCSYSNYDIKLVDSQLDVSFWEEKVSTDDPYLFAIAAVLTFSDGDN